MDKDRSRSGKTGPGRAWFKVQFVQTTLGQKSRLKKFFFNVFKIPYFFHFPNTKSSFLLSVHGKNQSKTRVKSFLERWGTTFLPKRQPPLIFV